MSTNIPDLLIQQLNLPILKPHAQAHLVSANKKCKICAEPAARHIHYGATTCFSCKAFFRRSLQSKTAANYLCRKYSMCKMNIKTRKNCKYCRYMKCLAVGMNPTYVLSEEERKRRFKKRNNSTNENFVAEDSNEKKLGMKMTITDKKQRIKSFHFNKVFPEQAVSDDDSFAVKTISSPKKQHFYNNGMEHYRKSSAQKKQIFQSQTEIAIFQPFCPHLSTDNKQERSSIIIRNERNTEVLSSKELPLYWGNKTSVIKEAKVKIFKAEETKTCLKNQIKPMVCCNAFSYHHNSENFSSKYYASLDGKSSKGIKQEQTSDMNTSSESEDDKYMKIEQSHGPEMIFTEDEKHELDKLVSDHDTVYYSVNFGEGVVKEMLMCSMFGIPVSTSAAIQGYRVQVERVTRVASSLKCFTNLLKVDQFALLKENADLLVNLRGAILFDKKKKGEDQVMSSMGRDDMEKFRTIFQPMIQNHSMNQMEYNIFNSIQDPANKKAEEQYSFLQRKVADAITDNMTSILMTYIILFSSDFCSLEDRKMVERTQHYYLRLLERCMYCTNSRWRACSRMANLLNVVACVREMADIKKSRIISHSVTARIKR